MSLLSRTVVRQIVEDKLRSGVTASSIADAIEEVFRRYNSNLETDLKRIEDEAKREARRNR